MQLIPHQYHAWLDFEENNWHLINHHEWLLIIDDEENHENWRREPFMAWLTHRKDYWYDQHLIKRTNLENDWHIKIIGTINTSLSGLNSWLTHHKDYGYNQHLIMKTNLKNGGRGAWRRIGENSWDLGFLWSNFYFAF